MDEQSPRGSEASQQYLDSLVNLAFISSKQLLIYLKSYPNTKAETANLRYVRKKHQVQLKLISLYCV